MYTYTVQLYSWLPIAMNVLSSTPMINSPSFLCYINLPNYFIHLFIFIILLFILSILSVKTCDTKTVKVLYLGSRYLPTQTFRKECCSLMASTSIT